MSLAHTLVQPNGAPPPRWAAFLHGIFGQGGNLRTLARRVGELAPGWGAVLVDLRMHGQSQDLPPPHTVEAAAADLAALPVPIDAVVGHSFGGKVALAYARARGVPRAVVIDATPGPRPDRRGSETILAVLDALATVPPTFPAREDFLARMQAEGVAPELAQWLAMNVARAGDAYRLRMDLPALRAMLDDYWALDLWPVLEDAAGVTEVDLVLGGRSRVFDDADRARAEAAPRAHVHVVRDAGHWVHVDAPEVLAAIVADALRR